MSDINVTVNREDRNIHLDLRLGYRTLSVPWYDARIYGLKAGDDASLEAANNTALQAVIDDAASGTGNDRGGKVLLPEGIVRYNSMFTMKDKVFMGGMGREASQLKFTGTTGYAINFGLSTAPPVGYYHMALQDFWLLGNANCTGGIHMYGGMSWMIERLRISHFSKSASTFGDGHGIFFDDVCWEGSLKSCFISHNNIGIYEKRNSMAAFNAISIEGMNNFRYNNYGIVLGDPTDSAQTALGGVGSWITNNAFVYNVLGGLWVVDVDGLEIDKNYFEDNGGFDIRVGSVEVGGNTLVNNGTTISKNLIHAPEVGEIGIDIVRGSHVATFRNHIREAAIAINVGANSGHTKLLFDFCDGTCTAKIADAGTDTVIFDQYGDLVFRNLSPTGAILPDDFDTFADADATPSIAGNNNFTTANTGATSITDFDDGANGQPITIVLGDANTTFVHDVTKIILQGAANWTPAAGDTIEFVMKSGVWYETNRSDNT